MLRTRGVAANVVVRGGIGMRRFRWLSIDAIPQAYDLRRCGWTLLASGEGEPASYPALVADCTIAADIHGTRAKATTILLGIAASRERARWLAQGFGDALWPGVQLLELEQRALRLVDALEALPGRRRHGVLELDLLLRDGLVGGSRLGLHPREFGLLWRLAQAPGRPVSPDELLAEVWRMNFKPETNSLAVHVCRLRAKLASAGLAGIVSTTPEGCYALVPAKGQTIALAGETPLTHMNLRQSQITPGHENEVP
ncbi:MAG: winged helix-turn-helix domain-containing protein [Novosphingobium sp.]